MHYHKDWIERWALYHPDKLAVQECGSQRSLSYGRLQEQGLQAASFLQDKLKLKKGSRVAILADFCLEHILLLASRCKSSFSRQAAKF